MKFDYHRVTSNLKKYRQLNDLNQDTLADHLGIAQRTYRQLENNPKKLNLEILVKIAEVFNISVSQLLDIDIRQVFHNNNLLLLGGTMSGTAVYNDLETIERLYKEKIDILLKENDFLKKQLDK